jgi:hypothetical protein
MYISRFLAKNQCFVSKCDYYCDTTHAICGSPGSLIVSRFNFSRGAFLEVYLIN